MTSMIERVARALAKNAWEWRNGFWITAGKPHLARDPETAVDSSWKLFEREACAAIEAMREPTDLMGNHLPDGYEPGSHSAREIWNAMIDGALKD